MRANNSFKRNSSSNTYIRPKTSNYQNNSENDQDKNSQIQKQDFNSTIKRGRSQFQDLSRYSKYFDRNVMGKLTWNTLQIEYSKFYLENWRQIFSIMINSQIKSFIVQQLFKSVYAPASNSTFFKEIEHIRFTNLTLINLYSSNISSIQALQKIYAPKLQNLNLVNNFIKDYRALNKGCFNLKHLFIYSQISTSPDLQSILRSHHYLNVFGLQFGYNNSIVCHDLRILAKLPYQRNELKKNVSINIGKMKRVPQQKFRALFKNHFRNELNLLYNQSEERMQRNQINQNRRPRQYRNNIGNENDLFRGRQWQNRNNDHRPPFNNANRTPFNNTNRTPFNNTNRAPNYNTQQNTRTYTSNPRYFRNNYGATQTHYHNIHYHINRTNFILQFLRRDQSSDEDDYYHGYDDFYGEDQNQDENQQIIVNARNNYETSEEDTSSENTSDQEYRPNIRKNYRKPSEEKHQKTRQYEPNSNQLDESKAQFEDFIQKLSQTKFQEKSEQSMPQKKISRQDKVAAKNKKEPKHDPKQQKSKISKLKQQQKPKINERQQRLLRRNQARQKRLQQQKNGIAKKIYYRRKQQQKQESQSQTDIEI